MSAGRCDTCHHWSREERTRTDTALINQAAGMYLGFCREGPQTFAKSGTESCGRFRIRETECGGKDARVKV